MISALTMPPPPLPRSKSSSNKSEAAVIKQSDAGATTKQSNSAAATSSGSSLRLLKKFRPFAPIPPFSGPHNIEGKLDVTSLEGIDISIEPPKILTNRDVLSKHQLPISQWRMYTAYVESVVDKRSTSTNFDETAPRTKEEDILDYVYDWAAWAAEIPDPRRRSEVLEFVTRTLERVLKSEMERTGMLLGLDDVKGAKSGSKTTLHGDVNIQVIITSSTKETAGSNLAERRAKDNLAKCKQAKKGAIANVPSEPALELPLSTEEAPKASLTKGKRLASDMDAPDVVQHAKRQKIADVNSVGEIQAKTASTADGQSEEQLGGRDRSLSEPMPQLSSAEEDKRTRYRQHIFHSRLNHILRKAGKVHSRGKCTKWEMVRSRLAEAGVAVKYRNMMLRDFFYGHEAWNGDNYIDPNEELAHFAEHSFERVLDEASAGRDDNFRAEAMEHVPQPKNSSVTATSLGALEILNTESPIPDAFVPAQPLLQPSQPIEPAKAAVNVETPKKLIVKLRTLQGFDPEDYSVYGDYLHENFMFNFTTASTVKERVLISDKLISHVNTQLDAAIDTDSDDSEMLYSGKQSVKNEKGRVVVTGNFVDLNSDYVLVNGLADPWSWKGRTFKGRIIGPGEA